MTTPERRHLWKSVFRQTARDPTRVGYWLRRQCRTENLRRAELARRLGLPMRGLVLLCLCQTPRDELFREDLEVICRRTGADLPALAQILRQQQVLAQWAEKPPPTQGWLMAASDAVPPPAEEEGTGDNPSELPHEG